MASKADALAALELRRQEKHENFRDKLNGLQRRLVAHRREGKSTLEEFCKDPKVKQLKPSVRSDNTLSIVINGIVFTTDHFVMTEKDLLDAMELVMDNIQHIDRDYRSLKKTVLLYGVDENLLKLIEEF